MPNCKQCGIWTANLGRVNLCPECRRKLAVAEPTPKSGDSKQTPFAEERHNAKTGIGAGILLVVIGFVLMFVSPPLGWLTRLTGGGFYLWGCWNYARAKGWHGWFGAFLGLTTIGLIVLPLLPDRNEAPKTPAPLLSANLTVRRRQIIVWSLIAVSILALGLFAVLSAK